MILPPIIEVIVIYNSKGMYGLQVEDPTRVPDLISLIGKREVQLETPKEEVEEKFGDYAWEGDNDSGETCSIASSDPSEAGSFAYTVKSVVSWKERTSGFFRFSRGK